MATDVKVPAMGESISSGVLASWHVADGDVVEQGQVLYELETDKITSEATAEVAGRISLKASEGDEVEIGQVVAEIDESAAGEAPAKSKSESKAKAAAPVPSGKDEDKTEAGKEAAPQGDKPSAGQPLSPAVRRVAAETGIDPEDVPGTGKGGRVTKADLLAAAKDAEAKPAPDTAAPKVEATQPSEAFAKEGKPAASEGRVTRKKMSPLRRKIAQRLVQSQQTAAILTTFNEVDMTNVMALRKQHQEAFVGRHGIKLGFMSFFVKAAVKALKDVPALNAQIDGEEVVQNHYYDIGVAIGTEKGLIVPVLRDCDQLSFAGIETQIKDYAGKASKGQIKIEDLQGGVFTISNGGTYGSLLSTPIINPPQSGIPGMHTIQQRPMAVDNQVVIRPM
ncbi:MAG: 2-oxoglutarate dehydrogenase complex dihydrolipoyllysine-residue succinyltransferase, partial [Verrucomicrobiota bacterium]